MPAVNVDMDITCTPFVACLIGLAVMMMSCSSKMAHHVIRVVIFLSLHNEQKLYWTRQLFQWALPITLQGQLCSYKDSSYVLKLGLFPVLKAIYKKMTCSVAVDEKWQQPHGNVMPPPVHLFCLLTEFFYVIKIRLRFLKHTAARHRYIRVYCRCRPIRRSELSKQSMIAVVTIP